MDHRQFDDMTRGIGAVTTRRRVAGILVGSLGTMSGMILEDAEAKHKKRKRKRKKKRPPLPPFVCTPDGGVCPSNGDLGCCGLQCCLALGQPEGGLRVCTPWSTTCCSAATGGGACPFELPYCCADGTCAATPEECEVGLQSEGRRSARIGRSG